MAKFCKYCGKELNPKEECDCVKKQVEKKEFEKAKETIKLEVTNTSKKYVQKTIDLCKNMLVNPKETVKIFLKEEDFNFTIIILSLTSIILAFCAISFIKGIYALTTETLNMKNIYTGMNYIWHFSYFKILCCIILGIIFSYIILAVVFQLGFERICKNQVGFKKTLSILSISMIEPTFIGIISVFFYIFSYKLSILLILYGLLLLILNLYQNYKIGGEIDTITYNRLFAILIIIFSFLAIYLIPNLFL